MESIPPDMLERLLDLLEDMEDAILIKERENGPFIEVDLDDL